ncbi:hypothetical protein R3Q59_01395 [Rhodococcus jostii]|uniref:Uncharacterized protein n=1 Tax=Rhodococcus jostii TaxID=132919 RepID=A0ABU4C6K8_RHOJO|nr:hypothetical protein [Rhodococcus jostii]MDV6279170.1 hypothetical protein [Rhodococcus jostii]
MPVSAHSAAISSKRSTSDGSSQSTPTLFQETDVLFLLDDLLAQSGEFVALGRGQRRVLLGGGGLGAAAFVGDPRPEQALVQAEITGDGGNGPARIDHSMGRLDLVLGRI